MIEFENVTKIFGNGTQALDDVSFSVDEGEFVIIQGKSGAGKTTLARLMLRELPFEKGKIKIEGDNVSKIGKRNIPLLRRKIGVVFQDLKILTDRTVKENIALALDILELEDDIIDNRIKELLHLTGLEEKDDMFPVQLSGGELQRVVIARALAPQPKIIFADEATGNLDEDTSWQIVQLLKDINEQGTAIILSTHDKTIINKLDERIIELEHGKVIKDTGTKKKPKKKSEPKKPKQSEDPSSSKKKKESGETKPKKEEEKPEKKEKQEKEPKTKEEKK